jgi:hypothetical protein
VPDPITIAEIEEILEEARKIKDGARRQYDEAVAIEAKAEGDLIEARHEDD